MDADVARRLGERGDGHVQDDDERGGRDVEDRTLNRGSLDHYRCVIRSNRDERDVNGRAYRVEMDDHRLH